jgi:hypothetical protein
VSVSTITPKAIITVDRLIAARQRVGFPPRFDIR